MKIGIVELVWIIVSILFLFLLYIFPISLYCLSIYSLRGNRLYNLVLEDSRNDLCRPTSMSEFPPLMLIHFWKIQIKRLLPCLWRCKATWFSGSIELFKWLPWQSGEKHHHDAMFRSTTYRWKLCPSQQATSKVSSISYLRRYMKSLFLKWVNVKGGIWAQVLAIKYKLSRSWKRPDIPDVSHNHVNGHPTRRVTTFVEPCSLSHQPWLWNKTTNHYSTSHMTL